MLLGGFASLTYLTKYSFIEEMHKPYVVSARAKGLSENRVLYGHVFRNAMLVVIAGLPEALVGIFLMGNVFIEIIFNLDGLGLLGFEAIQQRDYPVIFGTLFIFTLVGLFFVKLLVVFVLACVFENTLSRTRFMLTGRLTVVGFGISVLAFVFYFTGL